MSEQEKDDRGRFSRKGFFERKVRTIRLTDPTWDFLGDKADKNDMSRADFLEALANSEISLEAEEKSQKSSLDFDIDEVREILKSALTMKSREGTKMKEKIKEVLEILEVELDND